MKEISVSQSNEPQVENANNFIADIKNAAQQAQNQMGFIYEPTSGLYYDSRTGYYYNAVCIIIKFVICMHANTQTQSQ